MRAEKRRPGHTGVGRIVVKTLAVSFVLFATQAEAQTVYVKVNYIMPYKPQEWATKVEMRGYFNDARRFYKATLGIRVAGGVRGMTANLMGPTYIKGDPYLAGSATGFCERRGTFWAHTKPTQFANRAGPDRRWHSATTIAHELGHLLGAKHDETPFQLMHPGALVYVTTGILPLSDKSKREILRCVRGWK